jgi:hypothetical protein
MRRACQSIMPLLNSRGYKGRKNEKKIDKLILSQIPVTKFDWSKKIATSEFILKWF